jgi:poly-gamma-glutamate capsule biosynthesis protein CapA/YwtB (metallophosphatase superfamily)
LQFENPWYAADDHKKSIARERLMTNIVIAGDTCPIGRNQRLFQKGDAQALLDDLLTEVLEQADFSITNLECPLIREESPIEKVGPNLGAPVDCVKGLMAMGIDVVGLANNHTMDHGPQGLRTTIKALEENGIAHVGAGENADEARQILVREINGIRIGILAMAEHEFGIAAKNKPGVNSLDAIDFVRNINAHRAQIDKLIVLIHGGNAYFRYPSPCLMDTCRFLVEQGADAVVCQHSHCVGCIETYKGAPIIYGQGNFLFDFSSKEAAWCEGAMISLDLNGVGSFEVRLIPYRQSDGQPGARRMMADEERVFMNDLAARSKAIADVSFVKTQWEIFCSNHKRYYLHTLHGKPSLFRRLAGQLNLLHILDGPEKQRARLNIIRCESHREALRTILESEATRLSGKTSPQRKGV